MSRLDALRVCDSGRSLIRVGRPNDGGYVLALGLRYDCFLSGGIGDDNSFEVGILELYPELHCDAYDPASDGAVPHERYSFHLEPLPPLEACGSALVKIDIEGDEWSWLRDLRKPDRIAQIVIELHSPHLERWDWDALARLADSHALIHAHANNMDGLVEIDGVKVPGTIETTWLRRDLCQTLRPNRAPIPGPIDMSNDPSKPDLVLDWWPFVEPYPYPSFDDQVDEAAEDC